MTLYELIHELQNINYKVTSADFETNVLSVDANLEGDWHNWSVNIHTRDEERLMEEGEQLAYNCEKKGYNDAVKKACEWADEHPSDKTIMRVLNAIGYEKESWIEFVRKNWR